MSAPTKAEPGTAVAYPIRSPIATILAKPEARAEIEGMLRPGDSFDRIVVEVYHVASANADILKCSPHSIVSAVARAVSTGLVIGETVHLVPFGNRLQAITDYKGKAELIVRAGAARRIDAHCVYANEHFRYAQGTNPSIEHHPILSPSTRGALIGAYAVAFMGNGRFQAVVLSTDEIEEIRQRYSKQHKGGALPYWYAQKTCVHRLAKLLPKNPELAKVLAMFEREEAELEDPVDGPAAIAIDPPRQLATPTVAESDPVARIAEPVADASTAALFPFPFGRSLKGKSLGEIAEQTLEDGLLWAEEQNDPALAAFIAAAKDVTKARRDAGAVAP